MKNTLIILACCSIMLSACKKSRNGEPKVQPEPELLNPVMTYMELSDVSVGSGQSIYFDFDQNGRKDLIFRTEAQSYDGNTKSRMAYLVDAGVYCSIAIDTTSEAAVRLTDKQVIAPIDQKGFACYNANTAFVINKVYANNTYSWEGSFKIAGKGYLAFQLIINGKKYLGWLEMSANPQTERLYFHRVAISKEPADKIYAGM